MATHQEIVEGLRRALLCAGFPMTQKDTQHDAYLEAVAKYVESLVDHKALVEARDLVKRSELALLEAKKHIAAPTRPAGTEVYVVIKTADGYFAIPEGMQNEGEANCERIVVLPGPRPEKPVELERVHALTVLQEFAGWRAGGDPHAVGNMRKALRTVFGKWCPVSSGQPREVLPAFFDLIRAIASGEDATAHRAMQNQAWWTPKMNAALDAVDKLARTAKGPKDLTQQVKRLQAAVLSLGFGQQDTFVEEVRRDYDAG